jgi:hypothetical protein
MKRKSPLLIEWRHFDKEGKTCRRCSGTGRNLAGVIEDLRGEFEAKGIDIKFKETKLPGSRMPESNMILLNGIPLEKLIPDALVGENACDSCSKLIDKATNCLCRTLSHKGKTFEELPTDLIKLAIMNLKNE